MKSHKKSHKKHRKNPSAKKVMKIKNSRNVSLKKAWKIYKSQSKFGAPLIPGF